MSIASSQLALVRVTLLAVAVTVVLPTHAQQLSVVRTGSFEIDPFVGVSYGVNETQVMGGGNVSFAINKYILPYAEFSYFPGIGRNQSGNFAGTGQSYSLHYAVPL